MFKNNYVWKDYLLKGILTFLFLIISYALLETWNTPAIGYEASIYQSTPWILWISITFSFIAGSVFIINSILKNDSELSFSRKYGFTLVFLSYAIVLSIFMIRGYYMWCIGGDPASHLGWIKEILTTGETPLSLFYPIVHIYISEWVYVSGLDIIILHKIVPFIFELIFILFMYILAKTIFSDRSVADIVFLISCCFVYSYYIRLTPNILANFLLPLVYYLLFRLIKERKAPFTIITVIFLILMPLFHTVATLIILFVFISIFMLIILVYVNDYHFKIINDINILKFHPIKFLFFILIIWWFFWLSLFSIFNHEILSLYKMISFEKDEVWLDSLKNTISATDMYGYNVLEQIIKNIWSQIILCILSLLSLPILLKKLLKDQESYFLVSLAIAFIGIFTLSGLLFLLQFDFTPQRLLFAISLFGTIFAAYFLHFFLKSNFLRLNFFYNLHIPAISVIIILFLLFIGSLFIVYPSPYILTTSWQTTHSEIQGLEYTFSYRDIFTPLTGINVAPGRMAYYMLNPIERKKQNLPRYLKKNILPYHFGYDGAQTLRDIYPNGTDFIIMEIDRSMYRDTLPDMEYLRYSSFEFYRLSMDPGVLLTYSNGGFDYYKVRSD